MKKLVLILMLLVSCAGVAHAQAPDLDTPPIPPIVRRIQVPLGSGPSLADLLGPMERPSLPIVQGPHTPPTIILEKDIDDDSVSALGRAFDKLAEKKPKEVRIIIGSSGGSTDAGLEMVKMIERFPAQVTCIADGEVASMAFTVLEACDHRAMTVRSALMAHRAQAHVDGTLGEDDLRSAADSVHASSIAVANMTCAKSKVKPSEMLARTEGSKQWWIGPDEALRLGFVEKVLQKVEW